MAAIENLEIIVDVDISSALAALQELQEELQDLAEKINKVDARGAEGIDIATDLEELDSELTQAAAKIEAFESSQSVDIPMDVHDRSTEEILGRAGVGSVAALTGTFQDDMLSAFQQSSPMDFGGFNTPRGQGIGDDEAAMSRIFARMKRSISGLFDQLDEFKLRMSDLHNVLASIVPVLVVFLGAIPAVVTALWTLVAAAYAAAGGLMAIGALGALGFALQGGQFKMQKLMDAFNQVREAFIEAFAPLAERLQPLFMSALDGLERFFQAIASQGEALMALTDEAKAFGHFVMEFVPQALRTLAGLVESFSGVFGQMGQFLEENFTSMVRSLVRITAEAIPVLASMAMTIGRALPAIIRMSVGFMEVANALMNVIGLIANLLGYLGISARNFGLLTATILTTISAIALLNIAINSFVAEALAAAIVGIYEFWVGLLAADSAVTYLASTTLVEAITSLFSFIGSLVAGDVALLSFASSTFTATGALAAFMTLATLGAAVALVGVATSMAASFMGLASSIDSATKSLKDFNSVAGRTDGMSFNPYGANNGAAAADVGSGDGSGTATSGGKTVINIESSGDKEDDKSNAKYAAWRTGRTTGSNN